jgi:hypothetical protein
MAFVPKTKVSVRFKTDFDESIGKIKYCSAGYRIWEDVLLNLFNNAF